MLPSIKFIYSSKHFDGQLMWYKIEKICLPCVHFSVCLIVSMNQVMGGLGLMCKFISFEFICFFLLWTTLFTGIISNMYLAEKILSIANWPIECKKNPNNILD